MGYAINLDWTKERKNYEKWVNHGRNALEDNCTHTDMDNGNETNMRYAGYCSECDVSEDSAEPMMNYIYPLDIEPDEEAILKTVQETGCTVMENTETGEFFLTLCGCGMVLSQDIALAYFFCQKWIPSELAINVCTQKGVSVGGKNWDLLVNAMVESLEKDKSHIERSLKEWKVALQPEQVKQ